MEIRRLRAEDYQAYHDLMMQVHGLHVEHRPDCYVACDPFTRENFSDMLADERVHPFCAEENGEVIGLGIVRMRVTPPGTPMQPRTVAFIDDVVVDGQHRGKGVGTAILLRLKQLAAEMRADSLELMVWSFNAAALRMYEKAGFTPRSLILEYKG